LLPVQSIDFLLAEAKSCFFKFSSVATTNFTNFAPFGIGSLTVGTNPVIHKMDSFSKKPEPAGPDQPKNTQFKSFPKYYFRAKTQQDL
jgi:hypothetical protein